MRCAPDREELRAGLCGQERGAGREKRGGEEGERAETQLKTEREGGRVTVGESERGRPIVRRKGRER